MDLTTFGISWRVCEQRRSALAMWPRNYRSVDDGSRSCTARIWRRVGGTKRKTGFRGDREDHITRSLRKRRNSFGASCWEAIRHSPIVLPLQRRYGAAVRASTGQRFVVGRCVTDWHHRKFQCENQPPSAAGNANRWGPCGNWTSRRIDGSGNRTMLFPSMT